MTLFTMRRSGAALLSVAIALAMTVAVAGTAGAAPSYSISISELTPANGSTVAANEQVEVSGFITSDSSIVTESLAVSIDGSPADVQLVVGSGAVRAGFRTTRAFAPGAHTVTVTVANTSNERTEATSTFTAVAGATVTPTQIPTQVATAMPAAQPTPVPTAVPAVVATPAPTQTPTAVPTQVASQVPAEVPQQLPATGELPIAPAFPALLALGTVLSLLGLRLRAG